jgi:radical SAM protein with 4Fe4S-binding SPASM domain
VTTALHRLTSALDRLFGGSPAAVGLAVLPGGPVGEIGVPRGGDGIWEVRDVLGRPYLSPTESSQYIYCVLPPDFRKRVQGGVWLEIEYLGSRYGGFRIQYASRDATVPPFDGLYKPAEQRWSGTEGERVVRRALFPLPDFDPSRVQNNGASFRIEFRDEVLISAVRASLEEPSDLSAFPLVAPLPELKKLPGRFYPINYLFVEITNACNFKCTWCPDEIMDRHRGFMTKEKMFGILEEVAAKKPWLGPLFPVKLHQMGEPMLHPDLVEIVARAESLGVPIELNTNCGLIREDLVTGLYKAGLTNLILSYQTPDIASFKTRKAPKLAFDDYREKVRLAVELKVKTRARTRIEIDIMNTKHADGYTIVSEDEQALAFLEDWIHFVQGLESRYDLPPREHDWEEIRAAHFLDQDEDGSRYTLLDGVDLIWKRCHTWGNVVGSHKTTNIVDTYCPAPYDQFVIQWNGDVATCCTDFEGKTKVANVFTDSIESVWTGEILNRRKQDMLAGRLLDVCAKCQGVK